MFLFDYLSFPILNRKKVIALVSLISLGLPFVVLNSTVLAEEPPTLTLKLPPLPENLPDWINNKDKNHIYRKRGVYNDAIYNIPELALDLNAVAVGHALAY
jgi:hypothetical protein